MAEMEKPQMMNLYAKLGAQINTLPKSAGAQKESGEFPKLLKNKSANPSKEPVKEIEKDSQCSEKEQIDVSEEVLTEEIKMPEFWVLMNAVQESVVQQSESDIAVEALVEPLAEEPLFVQGVEDDGQTDGISQTPMLQAEPAIESGQKLQEEEVMPNEQMPQEGWGHSERSDAQENVKTQQIQKAEEPGIESVKSEVQAERQKEVQPEHTGQQEYASSSTMQIQDHSVVAEEKGSVEAKLVTTENMLPEDLAKTVAEKMPAKNGILTLELEPASLGKLTIQMVYEEGRTVVSLMATNARTLELLSQRSAEIASILEDRTGEKTQIQIYEPQKNDNYMDEQKEKGHHREEGQRQNKKREGQASFLQQLRLGLI